jgi:hypothetical protein
MMSVSHSGVKFKSGTLAFFSWLDYLQNEKPEDQRIPGENWEIGQ